MAPVTGAREFGHGQPRAEPAAPQPAKGRSRANFLLHVDRDRGRPGGAGTGSAIFNTLRQVGGAVDGAVFGALLANSATFVGGMQISFAIAASMLLATAMVSSASGPPLMVWPASTPDSQINDEFDDHGRDLFADAHNATMATAAKA
ncbi:MAG: hypothetical protein ACXWEI_12520 [Mycobacterium sp.]